MPIVAPFSIVHSSLLKELNCAMQNKDKKPLAHFQRWQGSKPFQRLSTHQAFHEAKTNETLK